MSPSMDPHLYGRGCAQICVCMTEIYIVCLVAKSKFESSSHGSMVYSSSHDCLYLTWIYFVLVCSHDESHLNLSVDVLQDELCC